MNRIIIFILILLYGCRQETITGVSNNFIPSISYSINLDWNNSEPRSITHVDVKWNKWVTNDSTSFLSYYVKDVTTENDKLLEDFTNSSDTTYTIDFATGTFLKICVIANYTKNNVDTYISSDTMQFFTQPLSPASNIFIDTDPLQHNLTWDIDDQNNASGLIIYRSFIEEGGEIPNLLINPSNGLPEQEEWQWEIVHETTNIGTTFIDTVNIFSDYKYFYSIKMQIEGSDVIENYRYSIIKPAVAEMINPIHNHNLNLTASDEFDDVIILNWDIYDFNDFYSYEIWRNDINSSTHQDLINNGEKLVEVTNKNLNYFEDRFEIGLGKKWYYFIKTLNNYGQEIYSEIVEGDTRL